MLNRTFRICTYYILFCFFLFHSFASVVYFRWKLFANELNGVCVYGSRCKIRNSVCKLNCPKKKAFATLKQGTEQIVSRMREKRKTGTHNAAGIVRYICTKQFFLFVIALLMVVDMCKWTMTSLHRDIVFIPFLWNTQILSCSEKKEEILHTFCSTSTENIKNVITNHDPSDNFAKNFFYRNR